MIEFINYRNDSPRRNLDNPYYINLQFISTWINLHIILTLFGKKSESITWNNNALVTLGLCNLEQESYILR
jgi:hypothetical protein